MLFGVFSLADTTVAEVMTPRIDIIAVDSSADREEVSAILRTSEHARLLVYDGHPDAIAGVVYAKDILAAGDAEAAPWQTLIRPAAFVPEGKPLDRQLRDFQRGPSHLAVVVDEFGGTAGSSRWRTSSSRSSARSRTSGTPTRSRPIQVVGRRPASGRGRGGPVGARGACSATASTARTSAPSAAWCWPSSAGYPAAGETIDLHGYRLVVEQVIRRRVRRVALFRPAVEAPLGGVERALP